MKQAKKVALDVTPTNWDRLFADIRRHGPAKVAAVFYAEAVISQLARDEGQLSYPFYLLAQHCREAARLELRSLRYKDQKSLSLIERTERLLDQFTLVQLMALAEEKIDSNERFSYDRYTNKITDVARPTVPEELNEDPKNQILELFSAVAEPKELGELLRAIREDEGLSQAEVSRRMGVSRATVNKIEIGSGNPTWRTLTAYVVAVKPSI